MVVPFAFIYFLASAVLYAFADDLAEPRVEVPEGPVLLDKALLSGARKDPRVSLTYSLTKRAEDNLDGHLLVRFLYLVPTLGFDYSKGFATPGRTAPHVLNVTVPDFVGEYPTEFLGFSDCKTWYAVHLTFFNPSHGTMSTRAAGFTLGPNGDWVRHYLLPGVVTSLPDFTFFDFVRHRLHYKLKAELVGELPLHPVSLALDGHFRKVSRLPFVLEEEPEHVPAPPLYLGSTDPKPDSRVSVLYSDSVLLDTYYPQEKSLVRFLYLVPKLVSDLSGGVATPGKVRPVVLDFTVPDMPRDHLVHMLGFSNCRKWYAVHLEFWMPSHRATYHKTAAFEMDAHGFFVRHPLLSDVLSALPGQTLPEFVLEKLPKFADNGLRPLLDKLPAHPVTMVLAGHGTRKVREFPFTPKPEPVPEVLPPLVLDEELLSGKRNDARLSTLLRHTHETADKTFLRFLYLVPNLGSNLSAGLATPGGAMLPRVLKVTVPGLPTEELVEFVALSNCKTWYVVHLEFWLPSHAVATPTVAGFSLGPNGEWVRQGLYPGGLDSPAGHTFVSFAKSLSSVFELSKMAQNLPAHALTYPLL